MLSYMHRMVLLESYFYIGGRIWIKCKYYIKTYSDLIFFSVSPRWILNWLQVGTYRSGSQSGMDKVIFGPFNSSILKLRCTNKYIELPSENRVLARCMPRLISFASALSRCAAFETSENFKMKNSCPWWDSISGPLARQTDALSIAPRGCFNVIIYRRTISILISIYIAPRADVDRWNQIDCFIMYRNVIQYMTFLLLTIVDFVSSRM